MNCAVIAGKGKDELDKLEKQIDNAATTEEVDTVARAFPLGGIFAILQSSPVHLEPGMTDTMFNLDFLHPISKYKVKHRKYLLIYKYFLIYT